LLPHRWRIWVKERKRWAANPASGPAGAAAINSQTASINNSGVIGGVEGGCNYQVSPRFVVGVEGDWQGTGLSGSTNGAVNFAGTSNPWTESWSNHWLATIRGRAGYAAGPWLFYVTGGGAFANVSFSDAISFPGSGTANAFSQSTTALVRLDHRRRRGVGIPCELDCEGRVPLCRRAGHVVHEREQQSCRVPELHGSMMFSEKPKSPRTE
jgi:hypothetical protein